MVQHNSIDHTGITGVGASYGSNSNSVASANAPGASTLASRADHVHLGVRSITHTSNTYSGPITLTAEGAVGITSPTSGTLAINAVAGGGGGSGGGAPTDAQYLVGALNGTLTVEKVKAALYKNYDPDEYPTSGTDASTDEFDDSSLNGAWTWTSAPAGTVSESVYPGYLHVDAGSDASGTTFYLRRTYAPGATAFSVATKCALGIDNGNFGGGAGIALLSSADAVIWQMTVATDGSATASDNHRIIGTSGSLTGGNTLTGWVYLLITRDASNVYNGYFSRDGIAWIRIGGSTVATTVDRVAVAFGADTDSVHEEAAWDFVRVFSSVTRKIGA